MKAINVILVAALGLAGCHVHRDRATPSAASAPGASAASKSDTALEKSRDAMLGKDMDVGSQHWASSPAAASTAATPAAMPTAATDPAAASSAPRTGRQ